MPSVKAVWSGSCGSRGVQQDLCGFIQKLATRSHRFFDTPPLECEKPSDAPQIRCWHSQIKGKIVVSCDLLDETSAAKYGIEVVETQEKPTLGEVVFDKVSPYAMKSVEWPLLNEIYLYGIEFQLYDPRDWENGGETGGMMSFVFPSHQCPELNGRLIMVEDRNECQYYNSETIKQADWLLIRPSMIVRYYLEKWFDYFMGWTKYLFILGLYYWHWHDLAGYQDLIEKLDVLQAEAYDKISLRKAVFEDILERFEYEAVGWWKAFYEDAQGEEQAPQPLK